MNLNGGKTKPVIELLRLVDLYHMVPPLVLTRCLCAFALATAAYAQAVVEYAAKSATGALSDSGSRVHLGACPVDDTLITCVRQLYPVTFQVVIGMCAFVGTLMLRRGRRA